VLCGKWCAEGSSSFRLFCAISEFSGSPKAFMGNLDCSPPGPINSKSVQRLARLTENQRTPICIRIELFERIPPIGPDCSVALCVLNCFLLRERLTH
jgi:hypothetical protein